MIWKWLNIMAEIKKLKVDTGRKRAYCESLICVGEGVLLQSFNAELWRKEKHLRMSKRNIAEDAD